MHVLIANGLPWMGGAERWAVHTRAPASRRAALGRAGRERVERLFDMTRMIDAYEGLFDRAVSEARRSR